MTKAVRLPRELAAQPRSGTTVTILAKAVGISRPTAFRLLHSLELTGLVDRVGNNYSLGCEMARLGGRADPHAGLVAPTRPVLQELADELNETAILAVPNSQDGLGLVVAAAGSRVFGVMSRNMVGKGWPLHASSSGKVLLADTPVEKVLALLPEILESYNEHTVTDRKALLKELDEVREQGFGVNDNELEKGLLALSRPVRDSSGTLAAIPVNGARERFGRDRIPDALQLMQHAVDRLVLAIWQDSAVD